MNPDTQLETKPLEMKQSVKEQSEVKQSVKKQSEVKSIADIKSEAKLSSALPSGMNKPGSKHLNLQSQAATDQRAVRKGGANTVKPLLTNHSNPIGLPKVDTDHIIPILDRHVASLFVLFHQYQKHHWMVFGPQFRDLHLYLEEAYKQIHADLDGLAERMTVLGGIPTSAPTGLASLAYIDHEAEGETPVREMLKGDLRAEQKIITELRKAVKVTLQRDDYGTERLLKQILFNAEDRAHHLDHYLEKNTLTPVN